MRDGSEARGPRSLAGTVALAAVLASTLAGCADGRSGADTASSDDRSGADTAPSAADFASLTSCGTVSEDVRLDADLVTGEKVCLKIRAPDVTIDGGDRGDGSPWTIDAGMRAVENLGHDGLTVRNVDTDDEILLQDTSFNVIRDSRTGDILAMGVKDLTVEDSETASLRIVSLRKTVLSQRAVVRRNTIVGIHGITAFRLETGVREGDTSEDKCLEGRHRVLDNTIVQDGEHGVAVFFRCSSHNEFLRNDIEGGVMILRDNADFNVIRDNRIVVSREDTRAFSIPSGNVDKAHPKENLIEGNVFVARTKPALRLQAADARDNVFRRNVFIWGGDEPIEIRSPLGHTFDHNTFRRSSAGSLLVISNMNRADVDTPNVYTSNVFEYEDDVVFKVVGNSRDLTGFSGDNNVYYSRSSGAAVRFGTPTGTRSFEEWVEESGEGEDSIVGDPKFCDPDNDDLGLRAGSAARDAGESGSDAGALPYDPSRPCRSGG